MPCDCKFMLLAEELVIQILLNLVVVKDILRCKCVCKSWYHLITSPSFIDEHLKLSNSKDPYLLIDYRNSVAESDLYEESFLYPPISVLVSHETLEEVDRQIMLSDTSLANMDFATASSILGCCNGILCIRLHLPRDLITNRVVLWNPATRDAKVLPPPLYICHPENGIFYCTIGLGFGFDAKNNDYKVVAIQELRNKKYCKLKANLPQHQVEVYSLGTNSWRLLPRHVPVKTGMLLLDSIGCFDGVCSGGMYSWLNADEEVILSFDMEKDVFISTRFPRGMKCFDPARENQAIMVYNGCVAIAHYVRKYRGQPYNYELWVLGEYGVRKSWTKRFNFRSIGNVIRKPVIFGIWNDSEMYLQATGREVKLFDSIALWPATARCKTFQPYGNGYNFTNFVKNVISFNQSLVPLNKLRLQTKL